MDSLKICTVCSVSKPNSDYINNNGKCYKCVFAEKIALCDMKVAKPKRRTTCKLCYENLPPQRWTYCSLDCAREAKRRERHWTLKCRGDAKNWRQRFIF